MIWEELVTDGHVRAARFRFVAIPLVIVGIVFVLLAGPPRGLMFASVAPPPLEGLGEGLQEAAAQPVVKAFNTIRPVSLQPAAIKQLAPASEIPEVEKEILQGLNTSGEAPSSLPIQDVAPQQFWTFGWPPTEIARIRMDDAQVFGAIITPPQDGSSLYPAIRWLAVFKKIGGKWQYVDLSYRDYFYATPGTDTVGPFDIPVTLRKAMGMAKFAP